MSGFEIAGVVLGAVPIAIAAIEQCKTGSQLMKSFRFKEPYLDRMIQTLKALHFILRQDIKMTLLVVGVEWNESMITIDPLILQDPSIAGAVNDYLGDGAEVYYSAARSCHSLLQEIVHSIRGLASKSGDLSSLIQKYQFRDDRYELPKRLKFVLRKDILERQINDLDRATSRLRSVRDSIDSQIQLVASQPSSTINKLTTALSGIQRYAQRLYMAISTKYHVSCHPEHETRLFLESRSKLIEPRSQVKKKTQIDFTVAFFASVLNSRQLSPYKTHVEVMEESRNVAGVTSTSARMQRVTIRLATPPPSANQHQLSVSNICSVIHDVRTKRKSVYLSLSDDDSLSCCHFQRGSPIPTAHDPECAGEFISLEHMLATKKGIYWGMDYRMALCLTIISSAMQLISTSWLRAPLTSAGIRFPVQALPSPSSRSLPGPFISQTFPTGLSGHQVCRDDTIKNHILELWILLLEIWQWKNLDEYAAEIQSGTQVDRYQVAKTWVDSSMRDLMPFQHEAVTRCIEFTFAFGRATPSWEDDTLRKSVSEYVLKPIYDNCFSHLR